MYKTIFLSLFLSFAIFLSLPFPGYYVLEESKIDLVEKKGEGIGIFLINLDHSTKRYQYVLQQIEPLALPIKRVSGIYGAKLPQKEIEQVVDLESYYNLNGRYPDKGTVGCALSHLKAWHEFMDSPYEFGLIFEDDVSINAEKMKLILEKLTQDTNYWDIVNFQTFHQGTPLTIKKYDDTNTRLVVYLTEVSHAGAYLISRKSASSLIKRALPIKMPIDHLFTRMWEFDMAFVGIEPRVAFQTFGDSEIKKTTPVMEDNNKSPIKLLRKWTYKLKSYTIRFIYNLKLYFKLNERI